MFDNLTDNELRELNERLCRAYGVSYFRANTLNEHGVTFDIYLVRQDVKAVRERRNWIYNHPVAV